MDKYPDAKKHLQLSLVKSGIRILAGACLSGFVLAPIILVPYVFLAGGILIILAEVVGIIEELV